MPSPFRPFARRTATAGLPVILLVPLLAGAQGDFGPVAPPRRSIVAVARSALDSVILLDAHSLEPLATLPVGEQPHEIAASADGRRLYVADAGDSSVTVIDLSNAPSVHATWRLPAGLRVHDVSVGADGMVWAAAGDPAVVVALDPVTGAVERRYAMQRPGSWLLDAAGPGPIVVAHLEGGAVTLLDRDSGAQIVLPAAEGEIDAAAHSSRGELWSINARTGRLTAFDAQSERAVWQHDAGTAGSRISFTKDGRLALAVLSGDSTVVAIDVERRAVVGRAQVAPGPKVIALSGDGRRAYVTHPHGRLTMLDVPTMRVLRSIDLPGTPDGVAIAEPEER